MNSFNRKTKEETLVGDMKEMGGAIYFQGAYAFMIHARNFLNLKNHFVQFLLE